MRGSVHRFGFVLPPKTHLAPIIQSGSADVINSITDLPLELRHLILECSGASNANLKDLINSISEKLDLLKESHSKLLDTKDKLENYNSRLYRWWFGNDYSSVPRDVLEAARYHELYHIMYHKGTSEELSKLIQMKGLYETLTNDYSFVKEHINEINNQRLPNGKIKITSIKDMIQQLDSYKDWKRK